MWRNFLCSNDRQSAKPSELLHALFQDLIDLQTDIMSIYYKTCDTRGIIETSSSLLAVNFNRNFSSLQRVSFSSKRIR